jgi:hypothetical protein
VDNLIESPAEARLQEQLACLMLENDLPYTDDADDQGRRWIEQRTLGTWGHARAGLKRPDNHAGIGEEPLAHI